MSSMFDDWFKAQFKKLPLSPSELYVKRKELTEFRQYVREIEYILQVDSLIRARYTAARYAHNAFSGKARKPKYCAHGEPWGQDGCKEKR